MRITGLIVLLCLFLGLAVTAAPAEAEPCSFHPHDGASAHHASGNSALASSWSADDDTGGPILIEGKPATKHAPAVPDDVIAWGHPSCCHVAVAFVLTAGPDHAVRAPVSRLLPPREAPPFCRIAVADIFRPPAFA